MKRPVFRPQHEQRALNLFFEVCLIVREVDRGCRAIIFTNRMDGIGPAKAAQIFLKHGGIDPVWQRVRKLVPAKPQQSALQKILRAVLDHDFGKRRRFEYRSSGREVNVEAALSSRTWSNAKVKI